MQYTYSAEDNTITVFQYAREKLRLWCGDSDTSDITTDNKEFAYLDFAKMQALSGEKCFALLEEYPTPEHSHTQKIALIYYGRKERLLHPDGEFDNKSRWYPSDREDCDMSANTRPPSVNWPNSYNKACRSKRHIKAIAEQQPKFFEELYIEALNKKVDLAWEDSKK